MRHLILFMTLLLATFVMHAQQIPDTTYHPLIGEPTYDRGQGPLILIDEGHYNFHTKDNRYKAFANLLEDDGYVVGSYAGQFQTERISECAILVVSNAMNEATLGNWVLPTPSAFTDEEILAVHDWVSEGGRLFLIADHMPMGGAAAGLADAFGFGFTNGFAIDTTVQGPARFAWDNNRLAEHEITLGRDPKEKIRQALTFTGQAFRSPPEAEPILLLDSLFVNMLPDTAWRFHDDTPVEPAEGMHQGAVLKYGKGRVAMFGEAAMFSSQMAGPNQFPVGMSSKGAEDNHRLLLNIIYWLEGSF